MDYTSLINQAQQQGQARQADYANKANTYRADYTNYQGQANQAQGQIQDFSKYMQNEGSASNLYNTALATQQKQTGYDPNQMAASMRNLSQAQGSMSAYNDFANTAASKWGLNAGGVVAANTGALGSINNNVAAASQGFANQQKAYELAQTGANQQAGLGVQQQQTQLATYKQVYDNAFGQQQQASANMQAYEKMAQDQGGLTAQQTQLYQQSAELVAEANKAMAEASAAIAASKLSLSQAAGQDIINAQNQAYTNSKAYQGYLNGTTDKNGAAINKPATTQSNNGGDWFDQGANWLDKNVNNPIGSWWNSLPTSSLFGIK